MVDSDSQPPGWYTDPNDVQTQRYWDGTQWTKSRLALRVNREEVNAKLRAHHDRIVERSKSESADQEKTDQSSGSTAPDPDPLIEVDTMELVDLANALSETLDRLVARADDGMPDELLSQGVAQARAALELISRQPFVADPESFYRVVASTNQSPPQDVLQATQAMLQTFREDPSKFAEFLTEELKVMAEARASASTRGRTLQLAVNVVIFNGTVGRRPVMTEPDEDLHHQAKRALENVRGSEAQMEAEKPPPKKSRRKRIFKQLLNSFQAVAGAVMIAVDIPVVAGLGAASMALGGVILADGVNELRKG